MTTFMNPIDTTLTTLRLFPIDDVSAVGEVIKKRDIEDVQDILSIENAKRIKFNHIIHKDHTDEDYLDYTNTYTNTDNIEFIYAQLYVAFTFATVEMERPFYDEKNSTFICQAKEEEEEETITIEMNPKKRKFIQNLIDDIEENNLKPNSPLRKKLNDEKKNPTSPLRKRVVRQNSDKSVESFPELKIGSDIEPTGNPTFLEGIIKETIDSSLVDEDDVGDMEKFDLLQSLNINSQRYMEKLQLIEDLEYTANTIEGLSVMNSFSIAVFPSNISCVINSLLDAMDIEIEIVEKVEKVEIVEKRFTCLFL
jgi:hypothetical protein